MSLNVCFVVQVTRCPGLLPTLSTLQVTNRRQNSLVMITTIPQQLKLAFHGLVHVLTSLEYDVIFLLLY